ncbi:thiamine-monophosphate kinase [Candidatus Zixiibacteriota bacterium]
MINSKLSDFGENSLVRRIKNIVDGHGGDKLILDDAAPVQLQGYPGMLSVTTDPCPLPNLVQRINLGGFYHAGWLTVVKSLSDLAAAGSCPIGVTLAVEFSADMKIDEFDNFFKGASDCAFQHGTSLRAGNIKETMGKPHAVSFAIGASKTKNVLCRGKANPGELLFVIDQRDLGGFWAGVASHENKEQCINLPRSFLDEAQNKALTPTAKVEAGQIMLEVAPPSFVMDNSDGLLASADELARVSACDVILNMSSSCFPDYVLAIARATSCDPRIWALGWGTCQLLCASQRNKANIASNALKDAGTDVVFVGEVKEGNGNVFIRIDDIDYSIGDSALLRGEQFHPDSFWKHGITKYVDIMMSCSLEEICDQK